ncbi:ExbD/TolR family protein [Thioalkalivibrio sulfidiphilus]|uniref:Biopolymer transport protein ExbD/TolR n=1 Tax=Thioalkalivibrio sulfidiphilus (strain HL-EbGR7) TaxID=396588 RepID=B8GN93_THISH|nr:biopolymer transporter ExbD [Thioalkalivibrio sulfidiphilus]ACL71954.1 Biopolymer transport protein ExbD/TolR [Thioalkalivibrio sulfidiphilus HL-EbGr7]
MAFGGFSQDGAGEMAEINVIPLVDIMLVLLVIFIITAPVITHAVKVDLPKASHEVNQLRPETVTLSIDAQGGLYWNNDPVAAERLEIRLARAAAEHSDMELHLRADQETPYERVAWVLTRARSAGVVRIGFITQPEGE